MNALILLQASAQPSDWALFIGAGETFHVWNPETFLADPGVHADFGQRGAVLGCFLIFFFLPGFIGLTCCES